MHPDDSLVCALGHVTDTILYIYVPSCPSAGVCAPDFSSICRFVLATLASEQDIV